MVTNTHKSRRSSYPAKYRKSIKVSGGVIRPRGKRFVAEYCLLGKPKRKTFDTKQEAADWIIDNNDEIRRKGTDSLTLLEADKLKDAQKALLHADERVSLQEAVKFWIEHNVHKAGPIALSDYKAVYLERMKEEECSEVYIRQMGMRLTWLEQTFPGRMLQEISTEELKELLATRKVGARTKMNIVTLWTAFFNRAIEDQHLKLNPAKGVLPPRRKATRKQKINTRRMPEIFTVAETEKLFTAAVRQRPDMVAPLALSFFAGIRSKEIARMHWEDIDFENGEILIRREVAKTGDHRHIKLADNLRAWLEQYGEQKGKIIPKENASQGSKAFDNARDTIANKAKVTWKRNGGRHSFASYHYRMHGDETDTYTQMGHDDRSMFREHYKGLVRRQADAEKYWEINPPESDPKTIAFKAS